MNPDKESPCKYGLTPECFEEYPEFAKQAFAIRLLCLLVYCEITSKLPGKLGKLLSIPKWGPGYPWPDAPFWWDTITMPEYVRDTGALTPAHLSPFPPGFPGSPAGCRGKAGAYLFFDDFTTLDTNEWSVTEYKEGTIDILNSRLRMQKSSDTGHASITRADPTALLSTFSLSFKLQFISGTSSLRFDYWTGTYYVYIRFELPDILKIWDGSDWQFVTLADFTDTEYAWRFRIDWRGCSVFQNDVLKAAALTVAVDTYPSGTHRFVLEDTGDLRIDNFKLTGI